MSETVKKNGSRLCRSYIDDRIRPNVWMGAKLVDCRYILDLPKQQNGNVGILRCWNYSLYQAFI